MATLFSSALVPDNSTDAHFQAWAQFIEDTLVSTGGWQLSVESTDTAPGLLAHPTVANSKKGFRVYRLNDGGPSTVMRVDFGSSAAANTPGIWLTIGATTNGSGVVNSPWWNGGASTTPNVSSTANTTTGAWNSYGSANTNRGSICMFVSSNVNHHLCFSIGRSKDAAGNDTTDGLLLIYRDPSTSTGIAHSRYLIIAGGVQPTAEAGLSYILTRQNPSETFGGDIGVGVISHFKGVAQQPGTNMLITNSSDVSAESQVSIGMYSVMRNYIQLNTFPPLKGLVGSNTVDTNARCLMRYD